MATAGDLIKGALRLIGQLAEGEQPSNETYDDALTALNQLLDAWSTERLDIFVLQDQTFTWPANTATRTVGPSGNLLGLRPVSVEPSFFRVGSVDFPLALVTRDQYNTITSKTATGSYPTALCVDPTMPDATLTLYPVPSQALSLHLFSVTELSQPATIFTDLVIPPGYLRAFRFNLACELAAEFGKEPPAWVVKIAGESKAAIEKINAPMHVMSMPADLPGCGGSSDIYAG